MAQAAWSDGKMPGLAFTSDSAAKQQQASAAVRAASENRMGDIYRQLEAARSSP